MVIQNLCIHFASVAVVQCLPQVCISGDTMGRLQWQHGGSDEWSYRICVYTLLQPMWFSVSLRYV